jgi:hypothetical protein
MVEKIRIYNMKKISTMLITALLVCFFGTQSIGSDIPSTEEETLPRNIGKLRSDGEIVMMKYADQHMGYVRRLVSEENLEKLYPKRWATKSGRWKNFQDDFLRASWTNITVIQNIARARLRDLIATSPSDEALSSALEWLQKQDTGSCQLSSNVVSVLRGAYDGNPRDYVMKEMEKALKIEELKARSGIGFFSTALD